MPKLKFCGYCGNEKTTPERRAELTEHFHDVHKRGCEKFGAKFIAVNECAIKAARELEIDYTDPRMRTLLSEAVYRVMLLLASEIKR